jgi:hypothetical protein
LEGLGSWGGDLKNRGGRLVKGVVPLGERVGRPEEGVGRPEEGVGRPEEQAGALGERAGPHDEGAGALGEREALE